MAAKKATKKAAARKTSAKSASVRTASTRAKAPAKAAAKKATTKRKSGATTIPGISRIDQESTRTHGYFVRVGYHRTKEGAWRPKFRAFFGDAGHGGKEKGFKAAVKWLKDAQKK